MPIDTLRTNHFAVSVSDVEESVKWYRDVLGFKLLCRNRIEHIDTPVAHMDAPDSGFVLELYSPPGCRPVPEDRKTPDEDMKTNGNKHFSLTVEDHEKTLRQLSDMGVPVVFEAPCWGTYGIFIHDRDGNLIELFEGDMREKVNVKDDER
ncbi:MAG: VOC family protein [Clostridiales Family XIII bacterium]|nr:VOC family protein [Clostridiales Family XIII bacterium]